MAGPVEVTTGPLPNAVERLEARWRFAQERWVRRAGRPPRTSSVERAVLDAVGGSIPPTGGPERVPTSALRAREAGFALGGARAPWAGTRSNRPLAPTLRRAFRHGDGASQAHYRIGTGHRAWADPLPAFRGGAALERLGIAPEASIRPSAGASVGSRAGCHAARVRRLGRRSSSAAEGRGSFAD